MNRKMIPFLLFHDSFGQRFSNGFQKKAQKQSNNRNCNSFGIGIDTALEEGRASSAKIFFPGPSRQIVTRKEERALEPLTPFSGGSRTLLKGGKKLW